MKDLNRGIWLSLMGVAYPAIVLSYFCKSYGSYALIVPYPACRIFQAGNDFFPAAKPCEQLPPHRMTGTIWLGFQARFDSVMNAFSFCIRPFLQFGNSSGQISIFFFELWISPNPGVELFSQFVNSKIFTNFQRAFCLIQIN